MAVLYLLLAGKRPGLDEQLNERRRQAGIMTAGVTNEEER